MLPKGLLFNMAAKGTFLLPREKMLQLMDGKTTEVEYSYHRILKEGDNVILREYTSGKSSEDSMFMDGVIKTVRVPNSVKMNPSRRIYGINLQLILF